MSDFDDSVLKFRKRKGRRKPKVVRHVYELKPEGTEGEREPAKFADPDLQRLHERGFLNRVLFELPSGKEAAVYAVDGPMGKLAAKVYTDDRVRTFKADEVYREGRFIPRARRKKAMAEAKRTGLTPEQILWVEEEYRQLNDFDKAGIPVPEPIAREGGVILMGFIGDDGPAPRLTEAELSPEEAEDAFKQSAGHLVKMLELGRVHGDYSAYNLLWYRGKVFVIDLPQVVMLERNKHAWELLERDVRSLCKSVKPLGLEPDPLTVLSEVKMKAGY